MGALPGDGVPVVGDGRGGGLRLCTPPTPGVMMGMGALRPTVSEVPVVALVVLACGVASPVREYTARRWVCHAEASGVMLRRAAADNCTRDTSKQAHENIAKGEEESKCAR